MLPFLAYLKHRLEHGYNKWYFILKSFILCFHILTIWSLLRSSWQCSYDSIMMKSVLPKNIWAFFFIWIYLLFLLFVKCSCLYDLYHSFVLKVLTNSVSWSLRTLFYVEWLLQITRCLRLQPRWSCILKAFNFFDSFFFNFIILLKFIKLHVIFLKKWKQLPVVIFCEVIVLISLGQSVF